MATEFDSLGDNPRKRGELYSHWAGYWESIVEDLEDDDLEIIDGQPNLRDAFRKDTSLGQSERAIAEDHPNREILELLQNARDEVKYADEGQVFLAVTDDGLLIANNGRGFNFHNRAVEEAATGIGKTSKDTPDEIGKMGIGLKSILGKGESFEVWTKTPDATEEMQSLRVRFSKGYLLAAILNIIGYDHGVDGFAEEFNTDIFPVDLDLSRDSNGQSPAKLSPSNRAALMQFFLFAYPVPMSPTVRRTNLAKLADYLVHGNDRVADPNPTLSGFGGGFTTAVFVEFEDEDWRSIVTDLYGVEAVSELSNLAIEESGISTTSPSRVWEYADGTRSGSLNPETLIHFETIDQLDAVRVSDGEIDSHITWEIRPDGGELSDKTLSHTNWTVRQVSRGGNGREETNHTFDGYRLPPDEREHETRVLVPRAENDWPVFHPDKFDDEQFHQLSNYSLYLYYPISQRDPGLSFSLHGEFAVTPNRQDIKDVDQRRVDYNRQVIDESIGLVERIAERTAEVKEPTLNWLSLYPWILLPTDHHAGRWEIGTEPSETVELLGYLREQLLQTLRNADCIPVASGSVVPPSSTLAGLSESDSSVDRRLLLDWTKDGWNGLRSLYMLSNELPLHRITGLDEANRLLGSETESQLAVEIPSADILWGLSQLRSPSGELVFNQVRSLLGVDNQTETVLTSLLRDRWVELVSASLTTARESGQHNPGILCPAEPADALLGATARFFNTASSSEIADLLGEEYARQFDGIYLLSSQLRRTPESNSASYGDRQEETRILLPIENQRIRSEGERRQPLSRTVLWNVPDDDVEVIAPPEDGQFTVFFLAELAETNNDVTSLLDEAGEAWGIRKYQTDRQEYFRSLIESFDQPSNNKLSPTAIQFIADRVEEFSAADLNSLPDGYVSHDLLETVLENQEYDRLRTRFRLRNTVFDWGTEAGGEFGQTPLSEHNFGPQWWPLLHDEPKPSGEIEEVLSTGSPSPEELADDGGDELGVNREPPVATEYFTESSLPAPDADFWRPVIHQMNASDTATAAKQIASTLCLFGVGITPSIRALCHHGPGLERPNEGITKSSWNPRDWERPAERDRDVEALQSELTEKSSSAYVAFVTGFGNHSVQTGNHTSNSCHGQPYTVDRGYGARISAWIWSDDIGRLSSSPTILIDWLNRHSDTLLQTLLETGWYCDGDGYHVQRSWTTPIPTLFNWQLRNAAAWEPLFNDQFGDWRSDAWGEDAVRLRWAVKGEGRGEVIQLLPTISEDGGSDRGLADDLLTSFGVRPIGELTAIEAADRLQKLQTVLSTSEADTLDTDQPIPMRTDGVESAWMYVYTELLNPILDSLSNPVENVPSVVESALLTHLPFRHRENEWYAVPIETIRSDSDLEFKYHTQRSLRQWEKQAARNSDELYLLKPPTRGGLKPLADYLDISSFDVEKPILQAQDLDSLSQNGLSPVKAALERRTEWILATLNRTNPDTIRDARDDFQIAIDHLARTELDEAQTADFFDERSRLYRISDEDDADIGIVLNDAAMDEPDSNEMVEACAAAIAFLFEMPGRYEEIQPALQKPIDRPEEREREWEQRGHDLELVRTALGTQDIRELTRDIEHLYELIDALDRTVPKNLERIRSNLSEVDSTTVQWIRRQFSQNEGSDDFVYTPPDRAKSTVELLKEAASQLPTPLRSDTPQSVFKVILATGGASHNLWRESIQALEDSEENVIPLIQWLSAHPTYLTEQWLPSNQARWCARLEQFCILRDEREDEDLASLAALEEALHSVDGGITITWADTPTQTANFSQLDFSSESRWFDIAPRNTFNQRLLEPLIEALSAHTSGGTQGEVADAVRDFILRGEVPSTQTDSRTKQRNAFRDLQNQLGSEVEIESIVSGSLRRTKVATFGDGSGGGDGAENASSPRHYGERGERAEAAAVLHILQRLGDWLDREETDLGALLSAVYDLRDDQRGAAYKWHTKNRWNGSLERFFNREFSAADYTSLDRFVSGDSDLWGDPLVQILNSTQEYGLGFDFIDPFGVVPGPESEQPPSVEIVPVEVKAAGTAAEGNSVSFRFSTNQLRQAQAFVYSGYRYLIRLFSTPGLDNDSWLSETKLVDEIVLDEDNPPATVLGGRTAEVDGQTVSIVPAESVAGGEMYIERVFE